MIRLSKMADYGIVVLMYVAQKEAGAVVTARELASASGLAVPTVAKVVKTLARGKLLLSHRGVHGGYSLARAPKAISVVDVIGAMEGPVALTACTRPSRLNCALLATCPTRSAWAVINRRVVDTLAAMSLHELQAYNRPVRHLAATATGPRALSSHRSPP